MRTLGPSRVAALLVVLFTGTVMADPQPQILLQSAQSSTLRVQFVPPPELGAKPNRPTSSGEGAYALLVTVQGVNAQTHQPWTITAPGRSYAIRSPRDAASGLATGKRQHKPLMFTLPKSSLQDGALSAALARADRFTTVTLHFRPLVNGPTHMLVAHELSHGSLAAIDEYVEVGFTFETIKWTWFDGGKTLSDEWTVPPPK